MMKKTYINPTINVVRIQTIQMLAASDEQTLHGGSASEWGARRSGGVWDDDDDE